MFVIQLVLEMVSTKIYTHKTLLDGVRQLSEFFFL